jgi:hypothetical protein
LYTKSISTLYGNHNFYQEFHWNKSNYEEGKGTNLLQQMVLDDLHHHHKESGNIFFPFHGKKEWQLIKWFGKSSLLQAQINSFLQLEIVSTTTYSMLPERTLSILTV